MITIFRCPNVDCNRYIDSIKLLKEIVAAGEAEYKCPYCHKTVYSELGNTEEIEPDYEVEADFEAAMDEGDY